MPHISVKMYKGKSEEDKARLAAQITKAFIETIGSSEMSLSVSIEDFDPSDWPEKVYKPEILENADKIYKQPGYNPFKK